MIINDKDDAINLFQVLSGKNIHPNPNCLLKHCKDEILC